MRRSAAFLIKSVVFLIALSPACWLVYAAFTENLGANPIEAITEETGVWTLRFVAATLAITPLRRLTGWNCADQVPPDARLVCVLLRHAALLHVCSWLDQFFDVERHVKDVLKRPYITVGFTAFVLMIPLALTSTTGWIRRLGGKRWNGCTSLIYITGDPRRDPLLLAGEGRHPAADPLRRDHRRPVARAPGVHAAPEARSRPRRRRRQAARSAVLGLP